MTEEELEKIANLFDDVEELLNELDLTKYEMLAILYESGMLDEDQLKELCPL